MFDLGSYQNRFYRDSPEWPQTERQINAERHYRTAFLAAAREAAKWSVPNKLAIDNAWAERREVLPAAEESFDSCFAAYKEGHEIPAAQSRGRVQAFEYVRQCFEALIEEGRRKVGLVPAGSRWSRWPLGVLL